MRRSSSEATRPSQKKVIAKRTSRGKVTIMKISLETTGKEWVARGRGHVGRGDGPMSAVHALFDVLVAEGLLPAKKHVRRAKKP